MSQILSKLNAVKSKLQNLGTQISSAAEARRQKGDSATPEPTPILEATLKVKQKILQRHQFKTVLRWFVGNAGQIPALAKVLVSAAFLGSIMLVGLSVFFLPFPRNKIKRPQNVRTAASKTPLRTELKRTPASSPAAQVPSSSPAPGQSEVPPAPTVTIPTDLIEKIRQGDTPQSREKIAMDVATQLFAEKKNDIAVALLDRVTGENPGWTEALLMLSEEHRKRKRLDASMGALLRILQVQPTHALAYNNLGMIQMRKEKPLDAIPYFERSFALEKNRPESALNLAIAYEQTLNWGKAVMAYEHYLKLVQPEGGISRDRVITAARFRMQRLKAFARAQGTLEPPPVQAKSNMALPSGSDEDSDLSDAPIIPEGPVVDPNPIQTVSGNGAPAAAVAPEQAPQRAPAGVPTALPTEVKKP